MNEHDTNIEEQFYQSIAQLLECNDHCYKLRLYTSRTRWNNREPGNGRYPGHGLVRRFNASSIAVNLHTPVVTGCFNSEQAVFVAIKNAINRTI